MDVFIFVSSGEFLKLRIQAIEEPMFTDLASLFFSIPQIVLKIIIEILQKAFYSKRPNGNYRLEYPRFKYDFNPRNNKPFPLLCPLPVLGEVLRVKFWYYSFHSQSQSNCNFPLSKRRLYNQQLFSLNSDFLLRFFHQWLVNPEWYLVSCFGGFTQEYFFYSAPRA